MKNQILKTIASLAVTALPAMVAADDVGKHEFMNSCAVCHGATGEGDGQFTDLMKTKMPDLTTVAARNGGEFPLLDIVKIIDGRSGVRWHGDEMPIWGDRFAAQAQPHAEGDYGAIFTVRGRVLSLAYYLESIQK